MEFLKYLGFAAIGGVVTSLVEYLRKYNLIDLIVEGVKKLFGKAKSDVKSAVDKNL